MSSSESPCSFSTASWTEGSKGLPTASIRSTPTDSSAASRFFFTMPMPSLSSAFAVPPLACFVARSSSSCTTSSRATRPFVIDSPASFISLSILFL